MPIPPLVSTGDIVSSAHINSIRNELVSIRTDAVAWQADVNGNAHTLSNVNIASITQTWSGSVNGGASTLSNVHIISLTQAWSGDVSANSHNIVDLGKLTIVSMGTTAATGALASNAAAILLYNSGGNNWAGIGTDPSGNAYIRTGTSGTGRANLIVNASGQVEISNSGALGALVFGSDQKGIRLTNTGADFYDIGRRGADGFLGFTPSQSTFSGYAFYTKDTFGTLWPRVVVYNAGHIVLSCPNGLIADSQVTTSTMHFALDEPANLLRFKVRYSNGTTIKTGSISLA